MKVHIYGFQKTDVFYVDEVNYGQCGRRAVTPIFFYNCPSDHFHRCMNWLSFTRLYYKLLWNTWTKWTLEKSENQIQCSVFWGEYSIDPYIDNDAIHFKHLVDFKDRLLQLSLLFQCMLSSLSKRKSTPNSTCSVGAIVPIMITGVNCDLRDQLCQRKNFTCYGVFYTHSTIL